MADKVLIVESPAKIRTVNKYLGPDYTVVASYGHVRDLPPKDGSVRPDEDFAMDWELGDRSKKHVADIAHAIKNARTVLLATDPDREGEAIAWHVREVLRERKLLGAVDVQRVTFNELTKNAVLEALSKPRAIDQELVNAYLARRALDYLVGFTLSPVLWRKLPGSRSAGRVQSVALRLICEREAEVEAFRSREFWTVDVVFATPGGPLMTARLTHLDGTKLDKFALGDERAAEAAVARLLPLGFAVSEIERKQVRRNPSPPFTTSTLLQETSRKLGLGTTRTMRIAQKLYEGVEIGGETVGLITYMRTDGVQLSQEAVAATRRLIGASYGDPYVPGSPRLYKSTAKNAQEAHEAIRPTDLFRRPEDLTRFLERDEWRVYELVWKRTVASQMESALLDQVTVDVASPRREAILRATGSIVTFDGFLRVYQEDRDDPSPDAAGGAEGKELRLPPVREGDPLDRREVRPDQHFTQPPPRYSEASVIKRLEELGIGRPSTYNSILQVLQDRAYVRLDKRRLVPEDRGRLVTAFLTSFFPRYVEYGFTADLETKLDDISDGRIDWKAVLRDFWTAFSAAVDDTKELTIGQVLQALDEELGPHFFPVPADGSDPRACPACRAGRLTLKLGKLGAFIGCSNYPECRYTRPLAVPGGAEPDGDAAVDGPRDLGDDPGTGLPVSVRRGPYGAYVQLGPPRGADAAEAAPGPNGGAPRSNGRSKAEERREPKPKRVSLPRGLSSAAVDLPTALSLLALPREIGRHPESGETIAAGIGRFGPYLKLGTSYKSLPPDDDVLSIGLNRAVALLAEVNARPAGRSLGDHPADGKPVTLRSGRYGLYVAHGRIMASLPKSLPAEQITLGQAVELLAAKAAKAPGGKKPARATGAAPAVSAGRKKAAGSKAPARKSTKNKSTKKKTRTRRSPADAAAD